VQEEGASVVEQGCGGLFEVGTCTLLENCADGDMCTVDSCSGGTCSNVPISSLPYGDILYTGEGSVVDVDDILCELDAFSGVFSAVCPRERADLWPCVVQACNNDADCLTVGDGIPCVEGRCHLYDVDDILAVLDAFSGVFNGCDDPCP